MWSFILTAQANPNASCVSCFLVVAELENELDQVKSFLNNVVTHAEIRQNVHIPLQKGD